MKAITPYYRQPNPPGGPCEHCGGLQKGVDCPRSLMLQWEMSMGYVDGKEALPERYHGASCLSDFSSQMIEAAVHRDRSVALYWAFWAFCVALAFYVGRHW